MYAGTQLPGGACARRSRSASLSPADYFSGYGEGWGLYVEWLGTEMGIYRTPYEDFGRLTYEMWRATRLVIDTGLHAYGWSRDRALAYLRDNTAMSELEIVNEIDRYISWPGQAVAYKLGELQIRRHRADAERQLGARFDQRRFHDASCSLMFPACVDERMRAHAPSRGGESFYEERRACRLLEGLMRSPVSADFAGGRQIGKYDSPPRQLKPLNQKSVF